MSGVINKGVTLYTAGTPNGWKASIVLKELKYPHQVKAISIGKNEQKEDWFLSINPNGRIPAIVDHDNDDYAVFESGAILMYLAEKAGKLYPQDFNKRHEVNQWLFFQNAGVGPMQGQANHFVHFAKEKIGYGMNRYVNETKRLYAVLDERLKSNEWLAAGEYTIADISTFGWVFGGPFVGIDLTEYPHLNKWVAKMAERTGVSEGLMVPQANFITEKMGDEQKKRDAIEEARGIIAKASE